MQLNSGNGRPNNRHNELKTDKLPKNNQQQKSKHKVSYARQINIDIQNIENYLTPKKKH